MGPGINLRKSLIHRARVCELVRDWEKIGRGSFSLLTSLGIYWPLCCGSESGLSHSHHDEITTISLSRCHDNCDLLKLGYLGGI